MKIVTNTAVVFDARNAESTDTFGSVNVSEYQDQAFVYRLHVREQNRRAGVATGLMRAIIARYGDRPIYLQPSAFLDAPMTDEQLAAWYGRLGFEPFEDGFMVRQPAARECVCEGPSTASGGECDHHPQCPARN